MKNTGMSDNKMNSVANSESRGGGEMMKKLIVMGIVAMMVMGLAGTVLAAVDTDWYVNMRATSNATSLTASMGSAKYGTKATGATDGLDTSPTDAKYGSQLSATTAEIDCVNGAGNDRYMTDQRAPVGAVEKVWNLKVYAGDSFASTIYLTMWNPTAGDIDPAEGFTVKLYSVSAFGGERTEITPSLDLALNGTFSTSTGISGNKVQTSMPFTLGQAGDATHPYLFELVAAPAVPEPGSMLAMFSGLIGLVGYGIRRRK